MNKDLFRPFGENFSATASDYETSDSYRWVRNGAVLLLLGYLIIIPATAIFAIDMMIQARELNAVKVVSLLGLLFAMLFIALGCCFLAFSPQANERQVAKRFLLAYGIAIACVVLSKTLNLSWLDIAKNLAQGYGLHYLIVYFQVLATNRDNAELLKAANLTNKIFFFTILLIMVSVVAQMVLAFPIAISLCLLGLCFAVFYFNWLKTLWQAYVATRPIDRDFSS